MAKHNKMVPGCHAAVDLMKYEIAAELGLPVGKSLADMNVEFATELGTFSSHSIKEDYWGHITARDAGTVGGTITSRLIKKAEETMFSL